MPTDNKAEFVPGKSIDSLAEQIADACGPALKNALKELIVVALTDYPDQIGVLPSKLTEKKGQPGISAPKHDAKNVGARPTDANSNPQPIPKDKSPSSDEFAQSWSSEDGFDEQGIEDLDNITADVAKAHGDSCFRDY